MLLMTYLAVMPTWSTISVSRRKGDYSCHVYPNRRGRTSHPSIYSHSAGCIYEGTEEEKAGRGRGCFATWNYHRDTLRMEGSFACLLHSLLKAGAWIDSVQAVLLYLDDVLVGSRLSRKAFLSSLILTVLSRYLTIAWVTFLMHFLATVGHKV